MDDIEGLYDEITRLCQSVNLSEDDGRDPNIAADASKICAILQPTRSRDTPSEAQLHAIKSLQLLAPIVDQPLLDRVVACLEVCSELGTIVVCSRAVESITIVGSCWCILVHRRIFSTKNSVPSSAIIESRCVAALIKCACRLYDFVSLDDPNWYYAVDACHSAIVATSHHERKFLLKARISGLLAKVCTAVSKSSYKSSPQTLKLTALIIRSVRNAMLAGKNKEFVGMFATQMKHCTSLTVLLCYAEILYFASQSVKNRPKLMESGIIMVLMRKLEESFSDRLRDDEAHEACLVLLGCVKQLVKTKKGREMLVAADGAGICERLLTRIAGHNVSTSLELPQLVQQLQTSLCTLSLRCLSARPYPLANLPYPVNFDLSGCVQSPNGGGRHSSITSTSRRSTTQSTPSTPNTRAANTSSAKNNTSGNNHSLNVDYPDNASSGVSDCEDDGFADELDEVELDRLKPATQSDDEDDQSQADLLGAASNGLDGLSSRSATAIAGPPDPPKTPVDELQAYAEYFAEYYDGASECSSTTRHAFDAHLLSTRPSQSPSSDQSRYAEFAQVSQVTKYVNQPVKIAFPDWIGAYPNLPLQPLKLFPDALRSTVVACLNRERHPDPKLPRQVFSLDDLISRKPSTATSASSSSFAGQNHRPDILGNDDLQRVGVRNENADHLLFESRFESGNLRRADQIGVTEYELFMAPDINQHGTHHQWFYFEVSNMLADVSYTFNIVNCIKNRSMFSQGMQPVLFSVVEAANGRPGFVRAGHTICYYRNQFYKPDAHEDLLSPDEGSQPSVKSAKSPTKPPPSAVPSSPNNGVATAATATTARADALYSIRFNVCFRHAYDVCYIAYHYPYTYTYFLTQLSLWNRLRSAELYYRLDTLTTSLAGNPLPVMTITRRGPPDSVRSRPYILLSGRVHPGESNASWMMHGAIAYLLSDHPEARELRSHFVFKIVPMLNPDGVINGSHRCSLSGQDLNRQWATPSALLHPEIYQTKNMMMHLTECIGKPPLVYCDLHGHSKKSNVFMYGNNPEKSWSPKDHTTKHNYEFHELPDILESIAPAFNVNDCVFAIQRSKESTARIVGWRQLGIRRAYTVEATYAGCTIGAYAGKHVGTRELQEMGRCLCEAMVELIDRPITRRSESESVKSSSVM